MVGYRFFGRWMYTLLQDSKNLSIEKAKITNLLKGKVYIKFYKHEILRNFATNFFKHYRSFKRV